MKHYNFNELTKNDFDEITIFTPDGDDLEGKFTNIRIDRNTIPEGMYAYDLREGDNGEFCTIEKKCNGKSRRDNYFRERIKFRRRRLLAFRRCSRKLWVFFLNYN